ncbi:MAG: hypothetical protein ACFE8U_12580, partial [Candidatus Hermodarchaeota archaeon]
MQKTELIKFFLEYGFNISPDALQYALDWLSQKKISEEFFKKNITRVPNEITVINLEIMKKFLESYDESTKTVLTANQLKPDTNAVEIDDKIVKSSFF